MSQRIALYIRSSTSYQGKGLEAQLRTLNEYCNRNRLNLLEVFSDEAVSGKKSSRPQFDLMMKKVKDGEIDCVVTYSLSRIARNAKNLLEILESLQQLKVRFVSVSESIDTKNSMAKILITILGAVAEFEADLISSRVKNGLENAKAKGVRLGRPRTINKRLIRELRSQGMTYRKIASLTGNGLASIHRVLQS